MKQKKPGFARRYVSALRKHLKGGAGASPRTALRLGRQAVALGVETLELARIHEAAISTLALAKGKAGAVKRAERFFAEAMTPIAETHRAARESRTELSRLNDRLRRRTAELAATNRQLQRGIVRREGMETALKESGQRHSRLLDESLQLQRGLRQVAHQVLAAQEGERLKISRELQDEIAQTLLGINVRLLGLKTAAKGNTANLGKEIASTRQLVEESVQSINRFARELKLHRPARGRRSSRDAKP
jgi:signal transduction histidine kinase